MCKLCVKREYNFMCFGPIYLAGGGERGEVASSPSLFKRYCSSDKEEGREMNVTG